MKCLSPQQDDKGSCSSPIDLLAEPSEVVDQVIENGWAERHPLAGHHGLPANIVMVYGPRDDDELEVVADLVRASHSLATGSVV